MGKGQTGLRAALGLAIGISGFGTIGIQPAAAATSAGCTAANAGAFNLSIPIGNPLQFGGSVSQTFAAGDVITATTTGTPTGTQAFLTPGPLSIVNASFADTMGSATIPSAGTFTLTRTLSANVANGGTLTFTCAPGPMVVAPATPTTPTTPTTPPDTSNQEEADTATNATTTAVIVEDRVVGGILDDIITTNPDPRGPDPYVPPAPLSAAERQELSEQRAKLLETLPQQQKEIDELLKREETARAAFTRYRQHLEDRKYGSLEINKLNGLKAEADKITQELNDKYRASSETHDNIGDINSKLEDTPEGYENPYDNLTNGADGDEILFVGRDPFARALMRYRGFRLDVADTGEGFNDRVKPLSFTRTLSSTIVGWVRAVYTDYEQDDASRQEGDNILLALGAHKDINDDLRIGLFATSTWGDVSSPVNNLDIDTTGYSLGAYGRYKWGEIDVNASTRIGLTDNDITVSGSTGSYDTRLASATLGISGQEQLSDDVWMRPAISVTGTWTNREDYQNSAGTNIGGNTTWSGNVTAGPTIGTSLTPPSGFKRLEPAIGLQATYTFSDQDTQAGTVATSEDDYLSLSISPQLSMEFDNGASLDIFGSYFGIGADLDGWSAGGTLSIPLN
ncbi:autotransporter beta-domain protein [Rhodobiaceae bacterium]|nr:autotransporter beta-domain protein [Rhodobiaceae bacterium]